jgi:hypothetical protein
MILLEDSWLQLLLAGALGLIFMQFAFLGHEASHRQIFESGQANDRSAIAVLVPGPPDERIWEYFATSGTPGTSTSRSGLTCVVSAPPRPT